MKYAYVKCLFCFYLTTNILWYYNESVAQKSNRMKNDHISHEFVQIASQTRARTYTNKYASYTTKSKKFKIYVNLNVPHKNRAEFESKTLIWNRLITQEEKPIKFHTINECVINSKGHISAIEKISNYYY